MSFHELIIVSKISMSSQLNKQGGGVIRSNQTELYLERYFRYQWQRENRSVKVSVFVTYAGVSTRVCVLYTVP